jgi:hypothetical protein
MKIDEFLHFCVRAKYAKILGVLLEYAKSTFSVFSYYAKGQKPSRSE